MTEESRHRRCGRPRLPQLQRRLPGRDDVEVVAFTATQIPDIDGRVYPAGARRAALPGRNPDRPRGRAGRPRAPGGAWTRSCSPTPTSRTSTSCTSARVAMAAGADYRLLGPRSDDDPVAEAGGRDLRGAHRLRQEPDHPLRRRAPPRGGQARRRPPAPDAVRRPDAAGRPALRALRGPRRRRLHDRGARGVRAAPRRGQPRLRRASTTRRSSRAPRGRRT